MLKRSSLVHHRPELEKSPAETAVAGHEKPAFSRNCADEQLTLFGDDHGNPNTCGSKRRRVNGYGIRLGKELSMPEPIGTIRSYDDLLDVARARMAALSITFETLDAVSGVASGYSAKLLGPNPSKRFGVMSFSAIMGALGMQLVAVVDEEAIDRVNHAWSRASYDEFRIIGGTLHRLPPEA